MTGGAPIRIQPRLDAMGRPGKARVMILGRVRLMTAGAGVRAMAPITAIQVRMIRHKGGCVISGRRHWSQPLRGLPRAA